MQNRRDFFKVSATGALGLMALGPIACSTGAAIDRKSFGVGLQLYTIRDAMDADVPGSLKKISDLGYKYLELANYANGKFYGYAPLEFKKMVNDLGMEIISSHTSVEAEGITLESARKMADDHAMIGVKYCVQPWLKRKTATWKPTREWLATGTRLAHYEIGGYPVWIPQPQFRVCQS